MALAFGAAPPEGAFRWLGTDQRPRICALLVGPWIMIWRWMDGCPDPDPGERTCQWRLSLADLRAGDCRSTLVPVLPLRDP